MEPNDLQYKDNIQLSIVSNFDDFDSDNETQLYSELDPNTVYRKITGNIPKIAYLICLVEFSERLSYYLISGCLTNMIQRSLPSDSSTGAVIHDPFHSVESPGALNLGLSLATFTMQLLTFIANFSPVISGYYSDTKFGKFKSIWIGSIIGIFGHCLLVVSALPSVLKNPYLSYIFVLISIVIIAISAGFIKPNLLPLLLDQYNQPLDSNKYQKLPSGEIVEIDEKATLEKLSMSFYCFINWGCFLAFFGSYLERLFGFWFVYLITALIYLLLPLLLLYLKTRLPNISTPNNDSINTYNDLFLIIKSLLKSSPIKRLLKSEFFNIPVPITSISMSDFKKTLSACLIFVYFIPFYLNDNSLTPLQISLAAEMKSNLALPNDLYQYINPLAIIITLPLLNSYIYPYLRKKNINFNPVLKITCGFFLASIGSILGSFVQYDVYENSICGWEDASNCNQPANISKISWIFYILMFTLQAIGECFAAVTCYELAYSMSPINMRGTVVALFLTAIAGSSFFGEILSKWSHDPYLVNVFLSTGLIGIFSTILFWLNFRNIL